MIVIAGGILIAVIVIACRRCRPTFKRRHRRPPNGDSGSQQRPQQPPTNGAPGDDNNSPLNVVWTVEGTGLSDNLPPPSIHLKPPPYCESPPSYEDIKLALLQAKSNLDASAPYDDEGNTVCLQQGNSPRVLAPLDGITGAETTPDRNNSPEVSHASDVNGSQEYAPVEESPVSDVSVSAATTPNNYRNDVRHFDDASPNNESRFYDACNGERGTVHVTFTGDTETTIKWWFRHLLMQVKYMISAQYSDFYSYHDMYTTAIHLHVLEFTIPVMTWSGPLRDCK